MKKFREIELLSSYMDGQLNTSELARLESRLNSDPELVSVLNDLRAARDILRILPKRKAPRNFTLTRQMVGLKPPLPRSYPVFKFATVFATVLLMLSFTVNAMSPWVSFGAPSAPALGFGGGCEEPCEAAPSAAEEPAEAPSAPTLELSPPPTEETGDAGVEEEPGMDTMQTPKETENESGLAGQPRIRDEAPVPFAWQVALLVVGIASGAWMWVMRRTAVNKWR